ncbi:MAG: nucleotidyltransferase domain-containing protein [Salinivirgaceae bacterium]|nr:nucleotidyltransferase domain-containing protein [Salinivirgaceae bacterium]
MKLINKYIKELKHLCDNFHVAELYVFGSIAKGEYTDNSDIDFLVRFSGVNPLDYFDNYMDFKSKLEKLFSRNVDLVEIQTIKNPILKKSIDRNKISLYGREDSKVAV